MTEDRRIRKTKEAIKYALIDLLKHKTLEKITIKDITESADINRGTFYLHYLDKYDLLEQIEDEYIERLSQSLDYDFFLPLISMQKHLRVNLLRRYYAIFSII